MRKLRAFARKIRLRLADPDGSQHIQARQLAEATARAERAERAMEYAARHFARAYVHTHSLYGSAMAISDAALDWIDQNALDDTQRAALKAVYSQAVEDQYNRIARGEARR